MTMVKIFQIPEIPDLRIAITNEREFYFSSVLKTALRAI